MSKATKPATVAKPRSLILRAHEASRLAEAGSVLIVRACKNPSESPVDIQNAEWVERYANALGHTGCWSFKREMSKEHPRYGKRLACNSIAIDTIRCPFGPVGSPLVGKERHAWWILFGGPKAQWKGEEHYWGNIVYHATFGGGLEPVCEGFTRWRSSTSMPLWASRFPRLVHESSEVKRVNDATWKEIAAAGLPDSPRRIVVPGSWPVEYIGWGPEIVLAEALKNPGNPWAWFVMVRNTEHEAKS